MIIAYKRPMNLGNLLLKKYFGTQETTSRFQSTDKRTIVHCQRCVNVHQHSDTHGAELNWKIPHSVSTKT